MNKKLLIGGGIVLIALAVAATARPSAPDSTPGPTIAAESTDTPEPSMATVAPTQPPTAPLEPVTISGTSDGKTKRFDLGPGDYQIVMNGESTSDFGGNVIVNVVNDVGESRNLVNEIVDGRGAYEFSTYDYGYGSGRYYLDLLMPSGSWSVTFTPEP